MPIILGLVFISCGLGWIGVGSHMILTRKTHERERQEDREMRARELVASEEANELARMSGNVRSIKHRRERKKEPDAEIEGNGGSETVEETEG